MWANTDVDKAMDESNTIVNNVTQALGNTMDLGMEDLIEDSGPTPPPEEPPPVEPPQGQRIRENIEKA